MVEIPNLYYNNSKRNNLSGLIPDKEKTWMKGQPSESDAIGFCHNSIHIGRLSKKMMERHNCLGKECKYFQKYCSHPYWRERNFNKVVNKVCREVRKPEVRGFVLGGIIYTSFKKDDIRRLLKKHKILDFGTVEFVRR